MREPSRKEKHTIRFMVFIGILSIANFIFWFFKLGYKPGLLFWFLSISLGYGFLRILYMWYHYISIKIPKKPKGDSKFTVDIFTTYFPGEPYEMILETLDAIQKITYPHTTYLCDEANDSYLKEICKNLNVVHVTRKNRINAKAGNINNALQQASGEICVVLDPDHIPKPHFLDPILPYFNDPEIGFVQIVQSYYNSKKSLVARGAAEQTFQFYGPMMMSMNHYGTVNAIGANCTFRRVALDSIGGHAPGLAEDMHTAMLLYSKGWKSVYVPQVLAKGLVPEDLSTYFKQQLKWSRGTFDLLFYVYPKVAKFFSLRQKLHFALLPLHYLVGLIYLITFLIPILSLLLSESPWGGNIIYFMLIGLPLSLSLFLIRAYIQKWVIEKKERGFHIIGGLLQMNTWWIFLVGFIYTIFRKKIPYLPTPKTGSNRTPIKLILPNISIGLLSLLAIAYGLYKDFTPYSIFMAFFAFLNMLIMFFSIYLGANVTNENKILRTNLKNDTLSFLIKIKHSYEGLSAQMFAVTRKLAFYVLIIGAILFFSINRANQNAGLENYTFTYAPKLKSDLKYLGIFHPSNSKGVSDIAAINGTEIQTNSHFAIISLYHAWGDPSIVPFPKSNIDSIFANEALPMITWEPWSNTFPSKDALKTFNQDSSIFCNILDGVFDDYINDYAQILKSYEKPIFLRFAHEFDNPAYPWSVNGNLSADSYKAAWVYVFQKFEDIGANNVIWVWNPWKSSAIEEYYPGNEFVDWIGITLLNYGSLNENGKWVSFSDIYQPFHKEILKLEQKPVMLAEFGSLSLGGNPDLWVDNALKEIKINFGEIKSVVLFKSNWDKNIPSNKFTDIDYLQWHVGDIKALNQAFPNQYQNTAPALKSENKTLGNNEKISLRSKIGVNYKKTDNWFSNNYHAATPVLEKDFGAIKELGIDLVKYSGPTIYDHNILRAAQNNNLNLLYSILLPESIDFKKDSKEAEKLETKILETVHKRKDEAAIYGWEIGKDVWNNFLIYHNKPYLREQENAFLSWLKKLSYQIKTIDNQRPILMEIPLNNNTMGILEMIAGAKMPIDQIILSGVQIEGFDNVFEYLEKNRISYILGDITVENIKKASEVVPSAPIIIKNWQDEWHNNRLTLDGLLDFEGRKKIDYINLEKMLDKTAQNEKIESVKILLPTKIVSPGELLHYKAFVFKNANWILVDENDVNFEWHLLKTDGYKNILAKKLAGKSSTLKLVIPDDYKGENYELLLVYHKNGKVSSFRSSLNTPLHPLLIDIPVNRKEI